MPSQQPGARLLVGALAALVLAPAVAAAHFTLVAPTNWVEQGEHGEPLHGAPCGNEFAGEPTGIVTPFTAGEPVTITINETISHPGHYRVALAINDRSELPVAPPVTGTEHVECGTVPIQDPPVFPILADGALAHTGAFEDPMQSFQVTLPSDVTCTHCTLQVLEFFSQHDAPCFHYHCADISISPPCTSAADCADDDACTADTCDLETGKCAHAPIETPPCVPCTAAAECADDDACTADTCDVESGECQHTAPAGCTSCTNANQCADEDLCTADSCDVSGTCLHLAVAPELCDDGDACTTDGCQAADGCVHQALTLADAGAGFLGELAAPACAAETVPRVIGASFDKAKSLVAKATATPGKARRFLKKASKGIRKASRKATRAGGRNVSSECATAMLAVLVPAQERVACLQNGL